MLSIVATLQIFKLGRLFQCVCRQDRFDNFRYVSSFVFIFLYFMEHLNALIYLGSNGGHFAVYYGEGGGVKQTTGV